MMVKYELKKLFSPLHITILILILIFRAALSYIPYSYDISYSKEVYREYMNLLAGKTAAEAAEWIEAEKQWIEETLQTEVTEEMTAQEQYTMNVAITDAQRKKDAFQAVYEKYLYFCELEQSGKHPVFFYDLEWNEYLSDNSPDWLFLIFMIAVIIPYFTNDCGKIHTMLFYTKHGRKKLIMTKLIISSASAFLVALLLNLIEGVCFAAQYSVEWSVAPVYSLYAFSECGFGFSLSAYTLCKDLCNCLWSIPTAFLAAVISVKSKTASFSALLLIVILYIPFLLASVISPIVENLCIGASLSGHAPLRLTDAASSIALFCVSYTVHICILWISSVSSWSKRE